MDDDEKERLKDIVSRLHSDIKLPPYNTSSGRGYSREYQQYREEEELEREKTRYERLAIWMGSVLNLKAGDRVQEKLSPALRLLGWEITPGMVLSAAVGVGFGSFMAWILVLLLNNLPSLLLGATPLVPNSIILLSLTVPIIASAYTFYKPVYAAENKVVRSSGEMILSILYMVVYMRSSPNLEGAVRFAALNLDGPIAKDLKGVLWDVEVGKYNRVEKSLEEYTKRWKNYNDDFLESLQLLKAAMNDPDEDRRNELLQDSIDRILDGTREKMKHYAQSLKTPVMILNAMGAMLPVLGMIMLPLISVFLGDVIKPIHLVFIFNIMLPGFLYWFMKRVLSSRPPTVSSTPSSQGTLPERGKYTLEALGNEFRVRVWPIGALVFLLVSLYGFAGYLSFPSFYPLGTNSTLTPAAAPGVFRSGEDLAPLPMLMRSVSITFGLGLGIGVTKILGNVERKHAEEHLRSIEQQFPAALFELGNKISGGTPIEVALEEAAESTSELEISGLFQKASRNVRDMGMTFEESLFHDRYGALREYPSQMIETVMKAILESSEKGTHMAAMAMTTISRYLDNIHQTQEELNDLMEDTTTTIEMLAYLLAPVVSGVAVGMSQTIITAMFKLGQSFQQTQAALPEAQGTGTQFAGILGNLNSAIRPEMLQFVVGLYLIQLLYILGTFYMKITEGENKTYRNMFIGKVLISGMFFYTITLLIVGLLFGGIVSGLAEPAA